MMSGFHNPISADGLTENFSESVGMLNESEMHSARQRLFMQLLSNNYARSSVTMAELLKNARDNGGRNFNVFLNSSDSKSFSR